MTPLPHPRPLRVLFVGPHQAASRLESHLAALGQYGRVELINIAARELSAHALPNRYDVLVVPPGDLADLRPAIRRKCATAVRLLVLMPPDTAAPPAPDDLPTPGVVSLAVLPAEVALTYMVYLLAALADGDSLTTAAQLAWRQAGLDWPEPPVSVRQPDGTVWPDTAPAPPQPTRPTPGKASAGRGNINFYGEVTAGQLVNVTNPSGPVTIHSPAGERNPDEPPRPAAEQARLNRLLEFMVSACSLEETETLCFQLGVNHDTFGRLGRRDLAWRLIDTLSRRGRVDELIAQLARAVPERANELHEFS